MWNTAAAKSAAWVVISTILLTGCASAPDKTHKRDITVSWADGSVAHPDGPIKQSGLFKYIQSVVVKSSPSDARIEAKITEANVSFTAIQISPSTFECMLNIYALVHEKEYRNTGAASENYRVISNMEYPLIFSLPDTQENRFLKSRPQNQRDAACGAVNSALIDSAILFLAERKR